MLIILPATGQFEEIEAALDADFVARVRGGEQHDVDITMPRFDFDTTLTLPDLLRSLGLTLPFDAGAADFGGIAATGLFIADAVHKGTITVDEEGTEAAAVTGIAMEESAYPAATMTLNRPFLFAIVEQETGTILFLGRVLDPAS
jgi:serpin B